MGGRWAGGKRERERERERKKERKERKDLEGLKKKEQKKEKDLGKNRAIFLRGCGRGGCFPPLTGFQPEEPKQRNQMEAEES